MHTSLRARQAICAMSHIAIRIESAAERAITDLLALMQLQTGIKINNLKNLHI